MIKQNYIYKLFNKNNNLEKIYIGSSSLPLKNRLNNHKSSYKLYLNGKYHYLTSFELFKNTDNHDDIGIEMIELLNNEDNKLERERYYIENNNTYNKHIPNRSIQEYGLLYYSNNK